jgi:hypothetical protein
LIRNHSRHAGGTVGFRLLDASAPDRRMDIGEKQNPRRRRTDGDWEGPEELMGPAVGPSLAHRAESVWNSDSPRYPGSVGARYKKVQN